MRPAPTLTYYNAPRELEASLLNGEVVPEVAAAGTAQLPGGLILGDFDDSGDETYDEGAEGEHTTDESENDSEFAVSIHDAVPEGGRRLRTRGNVEGTDEEGVINLRELFL